MKKQANALAAWAILLGAALICLEVFVLRDSAGDMAAGMLIGIGSGLAGGGLAGVFMRRMREKAPPEERRRREIIEKDERYQAIREKAGYGAWYVTLIAVTALALVLALLGFQTPCLLVLGLLAVHVAGYIAALTVVGRKL